MFGILEGSKRVSQYMKFDDNFINVPVLLMLLRKSRLVSGRLGLLNQCEKPDRAADTTCTETHVEEICGINTLHSFLGRPPSVAMLPTFQEAKKAGAHFYLILSICWHGWKCFYIYDVK